MMVGIMCNVFWRDTVLHFGLFRLVMKKGAFLKIPKIFK